MAANTGDFGLRKNAAGQKPQPDAGASAGDETLKRPSQDASRTVGQTGPDIGRQACPELREAEGPPEVSQRSGYPRAGESGVGSNAGPICCVGRCHRPTRPSRFAAHEPPRRPPSAPAPIQRFIVYPGQFVPHLNPDSDQPGGPFAIIAPNDLSAPPCAGESAYTGLAPTHCQRRLLPC